MTTGGYYMKFVIVGDGAVGKTSLLLTYVRKGFPVEYEPTVMDNYQVQIPFQKSIINVDVWDTAGQENFKQIRHLSYANTDLFVVCYSCTSRASFNNVKTFWIPEVQKTVTNVPFVLVGTKLDLIKTSVEVVTAQDAQAMSSKIAAKDSFQCSALLNRGVEEIFKASIKHVYDEKFASGNGGCCCIVI